MVRFFKGVLGDLIGIFRLFPLKRNQRSKQSISRHLFPGSVRLLNNVAFIMTKIRFSISRDNCTTYYGLTLIALRLNYVRSKSCRCPSDVLYWVASDTNEITSVQQNNNVNKRKWIRDINDHLGRSSNQELCLPTANEIMPLSSLAHLFSRIERVRRSNRSSIHLGPAVHARDTSKT